MDEDTTYTKLPVEERCIHKLWKARVDGYEEAARIFKQIDEENSPEWNKFLGLVKKFVIDSHAMAQEKGLEATLIFVEMCGVAGKTVGEVVSGIVAKCLGSPKAKIKDLGGQIVLMYIEIERQEQVMDELIKGLDNKNPKIVATITTLITRALHEFGRNVIALKPLVKKIPVLLGDRDKSVRDETKLLTIEMFRWIGAALRPQLAALNDVLLKELDAEFEKVRVEQPEPSRYLRSQQAKAAAAAAAGGPNDEGEEGDENEGGGEGEAQVMELDLVDPIDILSKLPKDFYDKLESKKWQERKESLDALDALLQHKKFEAGDYGDLVRALKKVLTKDSNVVLVALSGRAIALLAIGLGKKFNTYTGALVSGVFEKFKEKKANVVAALREAIDAIYLCTSLEAMQEDLLEALNNKNPSVKSETALFMARALTKTQPAALNKKLLKTLVTALLKTLNEPDPTVRDSSAEALGTAMKLVGEKVIAPCLTDVDALKMNKIKECCEKAVITVKVVAPKKERPATAPNSAAPARAAPKAGSTAPKAVARPATATTTAAGAKKGPAAGAAKKPAAGGVSKSSSTTKVAQRALPTERDLSAEEVDEKVSELLPGDVTTGLLDANWKARLAAVESFAVFINDLDNKNNASQILVRTLAKKPGFKDTNFQVLKIKLEIMRAITEQMTITVTTADHVMSDVIEKLGDAKNSAPAGAVLTAIADCISLEYVVTRVLSYIFEQKSPKTQQEGLLWINGAIREFGFQLSPKTMIDDAKKAVQSINPAVRSAGITLLGTMYLYMGPTLATFFDGEKPALKSQIDAEFEKNQGVRPPAPTRGGQMRGGADEGEDAMGDEPAAAAAVEINLADLLPRVDISPMITEALLNEMADKNWKTRNEGLIKLQGILDNAKLIKPTIGDLPPALAHRIKDSNTKIAQLAIAICEQLANCMGAQFKQHIKVLLPGILLGLGDSKSFLKAACAACIATWGATCGYKEFFECEMIAEALKTGGPAMRVEVWGWLADRLPSMPPKAVPKDELLACLPYLFPNILDRNADVRKNANEAILGFMIHVGYDAMVKALDKETPTMKTDIKKVLDKVRPNLPVKALPKEKAAAAPAAASSQPKAVARPGASGGGGGAAGGAAPAGGSKLAKPLAGKAAVEKPVARKKEEEVDTSPLLAVNNAKNQRMIDEQKLRVLKWQFTVPREEFNELLREQMTTANVNRNMMSNMFHDDFRYHLKVIDALADDLAENIQGLVSNLDLVLKWISLRFYDTNPSVLIKGLDYLVVVLESLIEHDYVLTDIEANSFIPHLLTKIGDPKDAVKNGVRTSIRKFCRIYPYVKMFAFVMEGLKSKNARQRTECLDELGYLISQYGLTVITPSPQAALKEIAKHISDRDNSVRSAALNCCVQAYFLVDDKIYKFIGPISDKEQSMLDERIKRAKKTRPAEPSPAVAATSTMKVSRPAAAAAEVKEEMHDDMMEEDDELPPPEEMASPVAPQQSTSTEDDFGIGGISLGSSAPVAAAPVAMAAVRSSMPVVLKDEEKAFVPIPAPIRMLTPPTKMQSKRKMTSSATTPATTTTTHMHHHPEPPAAVKGPFGLDWQFIEELERGWIKVDQLPKREPANVDLSFLYSPLKVYEVNGVKYPEEKLKALIEKSAAQHTYMVSPPPANKPASAQYYAKITANQNLMNQINANPYATMTVYSNAEPPQERDLDPSILRMIRGLGSADSVVARASMKELNEILDDKDKHAILIDYEQAYVEALLRQFDHLTSLPINETLVIYQQLLNNAFQYLGSKVLCKRLSISSLKDMIAVLLGLMAETRLSTGGDVHGYTKVINCICLKMLDYANFTSINCALIILLRETCKSGSLPKFIELLMKCMWRNVKMMAERAQELEYGPVLREIHEFLVALPPAWWQQRPSDTPLRTIRTIIHNLAKIRNARIFDDIPPEVPLNSELRSYITRIIKTMTMDNGQPANTPSAQAAQATAPAPGQPANTDPEFWMKRLHDIKKGADMQTGSSNNEGGGGMYGHSHMGNTNLLRQHAEDSNRTTAHASPSIKEEFDSVTNHDDRVNFLRGKLAQLQMAKLNRN